MISAALLGGLSNQMFQIAAVYALALDNGDTCAFPFDRTEMGPGCHTARTYTTNIFKHIHELPSGWMPKFVYREPHLNGQPDLTYRPIPYHKEMQVIGYFPCEKYFIHHKREILNLFMDMDVINALREKWNYALTNSVSFHVRRGDYLMNPTFLHVQSKNYYNKSLIDIETMVLIKNILVFSDDIPWCKRNFTDKRMIFIEGQPDFKDLYLMSLCNHNILANSGFSSWAFILNSNVNKIGYVPERWFGSTGVQNYKCNYPENIIVI